MWDDSVNHAICINGFALNNPVCIGSYLAFVNEHKREEASHLSVIVVSGRIHIVVEVRGIEGFFYGNLFCVRFGIIVYFLLNIYARGLFQFQKIIASLEVDNIITLNKIIYGSRDLRHRISRRENANDLILCGL